LRKITRKKGPVTAKKVSFDGISFASGLEKKMYMALKKADIKADYEGTTYELLPSFKFDNVCFERQSNGKGEFINRGQKKIQNISYTPDFVAEDFIIECKGRANESFPMRWKMFKKYISENYPDITLFKPQTEKECQEVVEIICKKRLNNGK
jgi:hypothetical protein